MSQAGLLPYVVGSLPLYVPGWMLPMLWGPSHCMSQAGWLPYVVGSLPLYVPGWIAPLCFGVPLTW